MNKITHYIESGILDMYVMGITSPEESKEVEQMALAYPEVKKEIDEIAVTLGAYAEINAVAPSPTVKPFLMASIAYMERRKGGEPESFPPILDGNSRILDFAEWLNREDLDLPSDFKEYHAHIIGHTPKVTTAIVWIKDQAPLEVHEHEYEKFLIVEGSCEITVGKEVYTMAPGDYMPMPLHIGHSIKVTSLVPCKVILQRVTA
jgi:mannose-6-phosphate isomerase-like protein (cupin superfamily)